MKRARQHWGIAVLIAAMGAPPLATGDSAAPLASSDAPAGVQADAEPIEPTVVVRLFYGHRDRLAALVSRYDVFEYADHEAGYVPARLRWSEFEELCQQGYRLEIDEAMTAQGQLKLTPGMAALAGIPGYPCYRTVEETDAALDQIVAGHPDLAALVSIGSSWEKTAPGGAPGYDLRVLVLSSKARPGPKPRFFLMAEHHARELVTAEAALRLAEDLVAAYGVDADLTWLLDYLEVHILPLANPDGRKMAELGERWRKNTNQSNGCTRYPYYGTDLNRNFDFRWGSTGSSSNPCNEVYRGPFACSEPENQAIRDYLRSLFPDQRGPLDADAAPATATGLLVSLHSYGQLVLYPWGSIEDPAPNGAALRTLGAKLGFFNRYKVQSGYELYPTSGAADEWAYGELGVPAYTIEMGTTFFQPCADFETAIYPSNRLALCYAAKACRQPYLDPAGPDILGLSASPPSALAALEVTLTGVADSTRSHGTATPLPSHPIAGARATIDAPSWIAGTSTITLDAADGSFDSPRESLRTTLDTTHWAPGRHTVFVEARNGDGAWGVPTAVFVWIEPLTLTATTEPDGVVLRWPSVAGCRYSVLRSHSITAPFAVLADRLEAQPLSNTYTDAAGEAGPRFYRVRMEKAD
ncbi:MAG TPA: M14 family zinc carboxypeptidase [Verrucomicrobiota bacterium]|nr:M14 family zinc carboxypeptidase [Verrucomicrobiota bacterium]